MGCLVSWWRYWNIVDWEVNLYRAQIFNSGTSEGIKNITMLVQYLWFRYSIFLCSSSYMYLDAISLHKAALCLPILTELPHIYMNTSLGHRCIQNWFPGIIRELTGQSVRWHKQMKRITSSSFNKFRVKCRILRSESLSKGKGKNIENLQIPHWKK